MKSESVTFSSDGYTLHGILSRTDSMERTGVVILHPHPLYGGNMDNHVVTTLEHVFLEEKLATLRFNFRGTNSSRKGYSSIDGAVTDALNAIKYLKSNFRLENIGIVGYSFGASTALRVALLEQPLFVVSLSASKDLVSEGGFDLQKLTDIHCPILMFHGKSDQMIPFTDLEFFGLILGLDDKQTIPIEGEGHFYQRSLPMVETSIKVFLSELFL
ncbi:MAG: alpha/beta hydrolase [Candidatus Thorarchaeota archaeon]